MSSIISEYIQSKEAQEVQLKQSLGATLQRINLEVALGNDTTELELKRALIIGRIKVDNSDNKH